MFIKSKRTALTFLAVIILAGCNNLGRPLPPDAEALMPLEVGNYWVQEIQKFTPDSLIVLATDTLFDMGKSSKNGYEWHMIYRTLTKKNHYRCNTTKGTLVLDSADFTGSNFKNVSILQYPAKIGALSGIEKLVSVTDTVTIASGFFSGCHTWYCERDGKEFTCYYKPGVGQLRYEAYDRKNDTKGRIELVAYRIQK